MFFEGFVDNYLVLKSRLFVRNLIMESNGVPKSGLGIKIRQPYPELSPLSGHNLPIASKNGLSVNAICSINHQTMQLLINRLPRILLELWTIPSKVI